MKNVEEKHEEYISALDEGNVDLENEEFAKLDSIAEVSKNGTQSEHILVLSLDEVVLL